MVTFSINHSDGVTAVSDHLRKETFDYFNITREIEVIPNFVDLEKFKKTKKDHFKKVICPRGEHLVVHTSNFRPVKRIQDVIRVFHNICKAIPSKLLMIGDGPERPMAENLCRELGLQDCVRFLGKMEAVEEVLSIADLFLMPSEKESFGLAALEAMACEVPVVSSDAGGLPELNIEGVTGYLCPIGDVEAMTRASLLILQSDKNSEFRINCLKRAREFELSVILPRYESYYQSVISAAART